MGQESPNKESNNKPKLERIYFAVFIIVGAFTVINYVFDFYRSNETKETLAIQQKNVEFLREFMDSTSNLYSGVITVFGDYINVVDSLSKIDNHKIVIPDPIKEKVKRAIDFSNNQSSFKLKGRIKKDNKRHPGSLTVFLTNETDTLPTLTTDPDGYFQTTITHNISSSINFDIKVYDNQNKELLSTNIIFKHNITTSRKL